MTEKLKNELKTTILSLVFRSGTGIGIPYIQESLSLPDSINLSTLLAELVTEGRLTRRATLLNNGEVSYLYNVPPAL